VLMSTWLLHRRLRREKHVDRMVLEVRSPDTALLCLANGYIDWPIIINDSDSLRAPDQGPPKKPRRSQGGKEPLRKTPKSANSFRVQELLRSSKKVIVISGAGISANAGCGLNVMSMPLSVLI